MAKRDETNPNDTRSSLDYAEGEVLLSSLEAVLKGVLESEAPVHAVYGPARGPFQKLRAHQADDGVSRLLADHGCRLEVVDEPGRAVDLAARSCLVGRNVVMLMPAGDVLRSANALVRARKLLEGAEGFGMLLIIEDDVEHLARAAPVHLLDDLAIAKIEPNDVSDLRDMIEHGIRLSRAGNGPTAMLVASNLLHSFDTITARPNRVVGTLDVAVAMKRKRRIGRGLETMGLLRLSRRLELNKTSALPSPGERAPLGLVAIGPAYTAAEYLLRRFGLDGRIPLLRIGMSAPFDDSIAERLLSRCERVVVLEARPGLTGKALLAASEAARRRGIETASTWWHTLPEIDGESLTLERGDALRASQVARKIGGLLDSVSTGRTITRGLATSDARFDELVIPGRESSIGVEGAIRTVKNMLTATGQWLRERQDGEVEDEERIALMLDAPSETGASRYDRLVEAEIWGRNRFLADGPAAIRECASDPTPRLLVICDVGSKGGIDVVRLATASVPEEFGDRVEIRTVDLTELDGFLEVLRESVLSDNVRVLIARDGTPPRFDHSAIERSFREVDRLGFTTMHRMSRPAEQACSLRAPILSEPLGVGIDRVGEELETTFKVDRLPRRMARMIKLRVRPVLEQIEVVRTRPPMVDVIGPTGERPGPPVIRHGAASVWRCHIAGWRGGEPGLVSRILCGAGREMGYQVGCSISSRSAGPGRGAWSQLLFTRPRDGKEPSLPLLIPFGEADLLIGADPIESLRALGPDPLLRVAESSRTAAVVNSGLLADQEEHIAGRMRDTRKLLTDAIASRCLPQAWLGDLVNASRNTFLTERLIDVVLLGIAYQRGLIPVSLEAIERSIGKEQRGDFGRLLTAFRHGRTLSDGLPGLAEQEAEVVDSEFMIRRLVRSVRLDSGGRRGRTRQFETLLRETLAVMPGLQETSRGRAAALDFSVALRHALFWRGIEHAGRYARLITDLYKSDSGAHSRRMTAYAIFPLAEAMLIPDPLYVATMCTSLDQKRRIRERLGIRHARGDHMERRYLTRFELILARRRLRLDVASGHWPAWLISTLVRFVPAGWRGSRGERRVRASIIELVERATQESKDTPEYWERVMLRLNLQAEMGRLRMLSSGELRRVLAE